MSMLARTASGDFQIPMLLVTDPVTCTQQKITDEGNLWLQSWAFDQTVGMPWLQQVLGIKNPNLTAIRALIRRWLLATPRVVSVLQLSVGFAPGTRNAAYAYKVQLDTGEIVTGGAGVPFTPAQTT
jgi:hypothetical protein